MGPRMRTPEEAKRAEDAAMKMVARRTEYQGSTYLDGTRIGDYTGSSPLIERRSVRLTGNELAALTTQVIPRTGGLREGLRVSQKVYVQGAVGFDNTLDAMVLRSPNAAVEVRFSRAVGVASGEAGFEMRLLGKKYRVEELTAEQITLRPVAGGERVVLRQYEATVGVPEGASWVARIDSTSSGRVRGFQLVNEAADNLLIKMTEGDSFDILGLLRLNYDGVDLRASDYKSIAMVPLYVEEGTFRIRHLDGERESIGGPLVYVSGPRESFEINVGTETYVVSKFYFDPVRNKVYVQPSGVTDSYYETGIDGVQMRVPDGMASVRFGPDTASRSAIEVDDNTHNGIGILAMRYEVGAGGVRFGEVLDYIHPGGYTRTGTGTGDYDMPFVSERGTTVETGEGQVRLMVPVREGIGKYSVTPE